MRINIRSAARVVPLVLVWYLMAGCGGPATGGPNPPGPPPPPPPPPPPAPTTARLTIVIPPPPSGAVGTKQHSVIVIPGASAPPNRAAVTIKTLQCHSIVGSATTATCVYDLTIGQPVAIVAEENFSINGSATATQPMPPPDYPAEFLNWAGDFIGVVEPGFLRFTVDRARRIEAVFEAMQPILMNVQAQGGESVIYRIGVTTPEQLTLPPRTTSGTYDLPASGGAARAWFFLKQNSSVSITPMDDLSRGCNPANQAGGCSQFLNWSGACAGTGVCMAAPQTTFQEVVANTRRQP